MRTRLPHILMGGALISVLISTLPTSANALSLPVVTARDIEGAAPTEQVYWYGRLPYSSRGGRGWGGGVAAGLIAGGLIGAVAAAPYYGYRYPAYGYGYPAYYAPPLSRLQLSALRILPNKRLLPSGVRLSAGILATCLQLWRASAYWRPTYGYGYPRAYWW